MRFSSFLTAALSFTALASLVVGQEDSEEKIPVEHEVVEPQLIASAAWPETNPFGHVVNGEKNTISVLLDNKLKKNVTLLNIAGAIYQPETEKLIKNLTTLTYDIQLLDGVKLQLPYAFYSEFKPGDVRLSVWLEHSDEDGKQRIAVYDSIVTIVEPEGSIFDLKLISTYLIVSGLVGGLVYAAYLSFVPQAKKPRRNPAAVSAPVTVTATGAGGYQEEWIPEHHLRKPKTSRKKSGALSSGDELSGGETSGTEGKRRKGKK